MTKLTLDETFQIRINHRVPIISNHLPRAFPYQCWRFTSSRWTYLSLCFWQRLRYESGGNSTFIAKADGKDSFSASYCRFRKRTYLDLPTKSHGSSTSSLKLLKPRYSVMSKVRNPSSPSTPVRLSIFSKSTGSKSYKTSKFSSIRFGWLLFGMTETPRLIK